MMKTKKHILKILTTSTMALLLVFIALPTKASQVDFIELFGEIEPFTYTDANGTATTGVMSLSLNAAENSFSVENTIQGTFFEHLVADVSFDDGRGNTINGLLTLDAEGTFTPGGLLEEAETATLTAGVLENAGDFSGTIITGIFGFKHFSNCEGGGFVWCRTFLVPPSPDPDLEIIMLLPSSHFLGDLDFAIAGNITTRASVIPIPSALSLMLPSLLGFFLFARKNKHAVNMEHKTV